MIDQKTLKLHIHYDKITGSFTWLRKNKTGTKRLPEAGSVSKVSGYRQIRINYELYYAHRLAFLYVDGRFPEYLVDHINMNRSDNRWSNIRHATKSINGKNRQMQANNTSGYNGVVFDKRSRKWVAQMKCSGANIHIGSFDSKEDAAAARSAAQYGLGFTKRHGSK